MPTRRGGAASWSGRYVNGGLPKRQGAAARALRERAARHGYAPQLQALPDSFLRNSTRRQQVNSLVHHAEKKALAAVLPTASEPDIRINFRMCADCHAFFKAVSSAALEGRRILLREPTLVHVFQDGECSCKDRWRWEERLSGPDVRAR